MPIQDRMKRAQEGGYRFVQMVDGRSCSGNASILKAYWQQ